MNLFYLLGMLPGGISPDDLDYLWKKVNVNTKASLQMTKTVSKHTHFRGEK